MVETATECLKKPKGWGSRHTLAVLGFLAFAMSYAMRFNLSLAIVAMVKSHDGHGYISSNGTSAKNISSTLIHACPHLHSSNINSGIINQTWSDQNSYVEGDSPLPEPIKVKYQGEFAWNEAEQGFILGSFFWGYVLTQLPGGVISTKFGGKWPLGLGLFVTAIFAILTPWAARTHKYLLVGARVIQGLGEGLTTPAMHAILAKWAPPDERSQLGSIVYAGAQFGTAATMVASGYLIDGGVLGGWPSVFYVMGAVSLVWFVLWCIFMFDSPADHPRISKEELNYIQSSIGKASTGSTERMPTPWGAILTSLPVWAIIIGHSGHVWGLYTLLTELPTYMKSVLGFDIKQNGWMSAFPYLMMWMVSLLWTQLVDFLIARKVMKTVWVRKVSQAISQIGPALALIGASYSGCSRTLTVILLTIAVGINGTVYGGYVVNHVDIAPNHAGILMGITNTVANLCGFGAPYAAGLLINENPTLERWQLVFFIAAAIYALNVVFYVFFGSSTEQPWNRPSENIGDDSDKQNSNSNQTKTTPKEEML